MNVRRTLGLLALTACGTDAEEPFPPESPTAPGPPITVRAVYAVPADRQIRPEYARGIVDGMEDVRRWYAGQLGGPTFIVHGPPDVCRLAHGHDHYVEGGVGAVWPRLRDDLEGCTDPAIEFGAYHHLWVVYADIHEPCDGRFELGWGDRGLAVMGGWDLEGLSNPEWRHCGGKAHGFGRWRGGTAHELGHTFGLPHPPRCDSGSEGCDKKALMWLGYIDYPATYLRDGEKTVLLGQPRIFAGSATR